MLILDAEYSFGKHFHFLLFPVKDIHEFISRKNKFVAGANQRSVCYNTVLAKQQEVMFF